jgi:hypothetical protein
MNTYTYNSACNNNPGLPTVLPPANRIIAIGDVHGDMKLIIDCLVLSNVIAKTKEPSDKSIIVKIKSKTHHYIWCGKNTVVVQIGDQTDSCRPNNSDTSSCNGDNDISDDIQILHFFTKLNELAILDNGAVYSLIGNHELMNVEGNFTYTSKANIDSFKTYIDPYTNQKFKSSFSARTHAFSNGNEYANFLGCTRQSILIIGDFLFVHAGLDKEFLQNFRGRENISVLNDIVKKWLLNILDKTHIDDETMKKILSDSTYSPFWNRVLGNLPPNLPYSDPKCQEHLSPILDSYKIKGMIIGHTPQMDDGINSTCGNQVFRVDVGASKAFSPGKERQREPQVLEILKLNDDSYKYTVLFKNKEKYDLYVPDDNTAFSRVESVLPN